MSDIKKILESIELKEMTMEEQRKKALDAWFETFGPAYREAIRELQEKERKEKS